MCRYFGEATVPEGGEGRAPSLPNTLAFALKLWKIRGKASLKVVKKSPAGHDFFCRHATDLRVASTGLPHTVTLSLRLKGFGSTLGQLNYRPNCRNQEFPTPAKVES